MRKFSFALLNYFGELQPNRSFIFHIFAKKSFVSQALQANALSTLNWFIDRIFIPIPGIPSQSLNEMLLNNFFITKVQHEHTCSNIISRIYLRSEEQYFLVAAFKHEKNCPITLIPSNFPCHILSRSNSARKSIIGEISFFTLKPECRN